MRRGCLTGPPARRGRPPTDRLGFVTTVPIRASIAAYLDAALRCCGRRRCARSRRVSRPSASSARSGSRSWTASPTSSDATSRPTAPSPRAAHGGRPWVTGHVVGPGSTIHTLVSLRSFLDDISSWGWPDAPARRLVFPSDIPRPPKLLPRALPPDKDAALTAAVAGLEDRFARDRLEGRDCRVVLDQVTELGVASLAEQLGQGSRLADVAKDLDDPSPGYTTPVWGDDSR
jgi:hypothetical protein